MKVADPAASEMRVWFAMANAQDSFDRMVGVLNLVKPDLLQFEEPIFWPLISRLKSEGHLSRIGVAHSSYNFETLAWNLRGVLGASVSKETVRDLALFEREIASLCDVVFTVSQDDAEQFSKLGAKNVLVAENGVSTLELNECDPLNDYLDPKNAYALFVSSAHPPNAKGFIELAEGARVRSLNNGEILICGTVGPMIQATKGLQRARWALDRSRVLGWVDGKLLDRLYAGSRVVILPKTHGGGSNLKTAEALASGRPVVATRGAFIGFEKFLGLPGVTIADDPDIFWRHVDDYLAAPALPTCRSTETMRGLLWSECLKPMVSGAEDAVQRARMRHAANS
jgi:glycosyltransferase involved in cell wall biosynthesis